MERRLSPLAAPTQVAPPVISVFIPARNEAGNLAPLFEKIANAFQTMHLDGEVILVDDGSTDTTWSEALACAERFPFVRLYRHRTSLGVTEAMRTGFRHSRGEVVMFLPADLESDPEEDIPKLWSKLNEGYDIVAGWRVGRGACQIGAREASASLPTGRSAGGAQPIPVSWRAQAGQRVPLSAGEASR